MQVPKSVYLGVQVGQGREVVELSWQQAQVGFAAANLLALVGHPDARTMPTQAPQFAGCGCSRVTGWIRELAGLGAHSVQREMQAQMTAKQARTDSNMAMQMPAVESGSAERQQLVVEVEVQKFLWGQPFQG